MMNTISRNRNRLDSALKANSAIGASIYQVNKFIACGRFNYQ